MSEEAGRISVQNHMVNATCARPAAAGRTRMICLKSERVRGWEGNVLYRLIVLLMIINITAQGQMWKIQWSPSTTFHWSGDRYKLLKGGHLPRLAPSNRDDQSFFEDSREGPIHGKLEKGKALRLAVQ